MDVSTLQELDIKAESERRKGNFPESLQLSFKVIEQIDSTMLKQSEYISLKINSLFNIARIYFTTGKISLAKSKADEAMEFIHEHNLTQYKVRFLSIYGFINDSLGKYDIALDFFHQALEIKQNEGDQEGVATVIGNIGNVYYSLGQYDKAIESYLRAIDIYEQYEQNPALGSTLGNLGSVYIAIGSYDKALECFEKSLNLRIALQDKSGQAIVYGNIGALYIRLEAYEEASEYFNKAILILEENGDRAALAVTIINYAEVYFNQANYPKALELQLQALALSKEVDDRRLEGHCLVCIGKTYKELAEYSQAMEYLLASLHLRRNEIKTNDGIANTLIAISTVLHKLDKTDEAKTKLLEALELSTQLNEKALQYLAHKELAEIYHSESNWQQSDYHFRLYHTIEKEVQGEEVLKQSQMFEYRRKLEEAEKDRQLKLVRFQEQEKIFHNIFPIPIANRLIEGESTIAESYENVSIFFSDIVGFTDLSGLLTPTELVTGLNTIFTTFDRIATKYGLEKIKTIGDAYMAVCGVPDSYEDHDYRTAKFAIEILSYFEKLDINQHFNGLQIRIGLHCGTVVAGIIGEKKFAYDVWGDAVNIASRMESTSHPNKIHISEEFKNSIQSYNEFHLSDRGEITIRGKGTMKTYWLEKG